MLLSGNVQSEHVAVERVQTNDIIGTLTLKASVGHSYFHVTSNLNMSRKRKVLKKRYYCNINNLSPCRPVLLSGNVQSEHVAAEEAVQTTILSET